MSPPVPEIGASYEEEDDRYREMAYTDTLHRQRAEAHRVGCAQYAGDSRRSREGNFDFDGYRMGDFDFQESGSLYRFP